MRTGIALTVIAVVLAAGCTTTSEDAASDQVAEMPTSPETAAPDGPDEAAVDEPTESATSNDVAATDDPAEDAVGQVAVSIGDFFFEPDELTVEAGDTVTWTHAGNITHNVTASDDSFVSDNLSSGETFAHTFAEAGNFQYRCTLHGQMIATIDVS